MIECLGSNTLLAPIQLIASGSVTFWSIVVLGFDERRYKLRVRLRSAALDQQLP